MKDIGNSEKHPMECKAFQTNQSRYLQAAVLGDRQTLYIVDLVGPTCKNWLDFWRNSNW